MWILISYILVVLVLLAIHPFFIDEYNDKDTEAILVCMLIWPLILIWCSFTIFLLPGYLYKLYYKYIINIKQSKKNTIDLKKPTLKEKLRLTDDCGNF